MGCVPSSTSLSAVDDPKNPKHHRKKPKEKKPLHLDRIEIGLFGIGESGKSTIFKQMKVIHAQEEGRTESFTYDERVAARSMVRSSVVSQMKLLVEIGQQENIKYSSKEVEELAAKLARSSIRDLDVDSAEIGSLVKRLWEEEAIKATFADRDKYVNLHDGSGYFWDSLDTIYANNYIPSDEHMIRSRIRTAGFEEALFTYKKHPLRVVDLGGQRSERHRWLEALQLASVVLFVSSLCEYDQRLREDPDSSRFQETILLFQELLQTNLQQKCTIILLNKLDLFKEKIASSATNGRFRDYFTDYKGQLEWQQCVAHIRGRFEKLAGESNMRVSVHALVAIETDSIKIAWSDIRRMIVEQALSIAFGPM